MYPILFEIGGRPVYAFGTFLAVGFFLAYLYAGWRCRQIDVSDTHVLNIMILLIVAGVVGSRGLAVMLHPQNYPDLRSVLRVTDGGMAFHGGLMLALASGVGYLALTKLPVLAVLDRFAPAVPLAHASGRIGCFLFGCCYGIVCDLPWAFPMPPADEHGHWAVRHPTQLYELALLLGLTYVLHRAIDRPHRSGMIFVSYGYGYAMVRFPLEFIRADHFTEPHYLGLSVGQVSCLAMAAVAGLAQWLLRGRPIEEPPSGPHEAGSKGKPRGKRGRPDAR